MKTSTWARGLAFLAICAFTGNAPALAGQYTGKVIGHGVAGEVEGMLVSAEFHGSGGVDYYTAQLLDPHAMK